MEEARSSQRRRGDPSEELIELLLEVRDRLLAQPDVDLESVTEALHAVEKALARRREEESRRGGLFHRLSAALSACRRHQPVLAWFGLEGSLPLEEEAYRRLPVDALEPVTGWVEELAGELGRAAERQGELVRQFSPAAMAALQESRQALEQALAAIGNALGQPRDAKEGAPAPEPRDEPAPGNGPGPALEAAPSPLPEAKPAPLPKAKSVPPPVTVPETPPAGVKKPPASSPEAREAVPQSPTAIQSELFRLIPGLFWHALAAGDMAGAFWLAREHEALAGGASASTSRGASAPVLPSWAVLALHLGLESDLDDVEAHDALEDVILAHPDPVGELTARTGLPQGLCARLALLAAARPALLFPQTGAGSWLSAVESQEAEDPLVNELASAIHDAAQSGAEPHQLRAALRAASSRARGEPADPAKISEDLRKWLDKARQAKLLSPLGARTLRDLAGRHGVIGSAVEGVLRQRRDAAFGVQRLLEGPLVSWEAARALVEQRSAELNRPRNVPLEARALDQVASKLMQLSDLLWNWLYHATGEKQWDGRAEKAAERFLQAVEKMSRIEAQESRAHFPWRPPWIAPEDAMMAAASEGETALPSWEETVSPEAAVEQFTAGALRSLGQLREADWAMSLALPLLFTDEPPLTVAGKPDLGPAASTGGAVAWVLLSGRTAREAFERHLERYDFLAARLLLSFVERWQLSGAEEMDRRFERARAAGMEQLKRLIDTARAGLEEATIYHALTEEVRAELDGRILAVEEGADERLGEELGALREILQEIERHLDIRRRSLMMYGEELARTLDEKHRGSPLEPGLRRYLQESERLLEEGDLALADEYLTHVEQALSQGVDPKWDVVEVQTVLSRALDAFRESLEHAAGLAPPDPERAGPGVKAYQELKRSRSLKPDELDRLVPIFEHVGFTVKKLRLLSGERDRFHLQAELSDGDASPLPEFGAYQRRGLYDVVIIFGEPGHDVIAQTLNTLRLTRSHPIVLYVGRLTRRQRQDWSHYCRREGVTVLLLDEALLYFLATQEEHRLPIAVSCGVAWGYANPYEPQGPVPREMFKGRVDERRALVEGRSSFIYGGRQFGKSVLLSMVERELHVPERSSYAFYEDIRQIGKQAPASQIWGRIRQALIGAKLIDRRAPADPERLVDHLRRLMDREPQLRIAFLFDEADAFLDADLRSDFTEVHRLKRVVESSGWRFRVIFSGLHSVQRFERLKNQPFAHLGKPVVVGPLDPKSAIALIQEPMTALGFRFDSRETLLRILSYTNYHPALIQLFCKELVNLVRQERDEPPYIVTKQDVESLYLRPELRAQLVQRYEWTLDLDDRYRALVYAMIVAQKQENDGFRKEYTAGELWELAYERWPQGFSEEPDDAFRSYLEELRGLGILLRMPSGKYRLRNGNVVRGLGSIETIEEKLAAIASRPAPALPDSRQTMLILELGGKRLAGPLTAGQASDLCADAPGVSIVLGSRALNLDRVQASLEELARQAAIGWEPRIVVRALPQDATDIGSVREYLTQASRSELKEGLVTVCAWSDHPAFRGRSLTATVRELDGWLRSRGARRTWARLVLLFKPKDIYDWMMAQGATAPERIAEGDGIVVLRRWSHAVTKTALADLELTATDTTTGRVLEATGGWPLLLDWVLDRAQPAEGRNAAGAGLDEIAGQLEAALAQGAGGLSEAFVRALGVGEVPYGLELFRLLSGLGPISESDIVAAAEVLAEESSGRLSPQQAIALGATLRALGVVDWRAGQLCVERIAERLLVGKKEGA